MAWSRAYLARRRELRKAMKRERARGLHSLLRADLGWALLFIAVTTLVAGGLGVLMQGRSPYYTGQRVTQPVVSRVAFQAVNEGKTAEVRKQAAVSAPSIYEPNEPFLADLRSKLQTLGSVGADAAAQSIEQLPAQVAKQLHLTPESFAQLRKVLLRDRKLTWSQRVDQFLDRLQRMAILSSDRFRTERDLDKRSKQLVIRIGSEEVSREFKDLRDVGDADRTRLQEDVRAAAKVFEEPALVQTVAAIVLQDPLPTVLYDDVETKAARERAADGAKLVVDQVEKHQVLFTPGQTLGEADVRLLRYERQMLEGQLGEWGRWLRGLGVMALAGLVACGLWSYIWVYHHRVAVNPVRGLSITALLLLALGAAVAGVALNPASTVIFACFPALLVAIVVCIAYDQRFALALGMLNCLLITLTLGLGVDSMMLNATGVAAVVMQLPDVRTRSKLVWVGIWTGLALAAAAAALGVVTRPPDLPGLSRLVVEEAGQALITAVGVGLLAQGILPAIERVFKTSTSMTLKELIDASHPLLRRLAQEAPGTYQHSLRIADMAEAAAQSVGASGLLCKVGAMFHDIGKSNKPHYFIENQAGGPNRHEKLSPAMSLLIIVGHVKDGVEMAREYHLPREVIHFIEAHHGTTLVEYFYQAALRRSTQSDGAAPDEFDFRYPGPKPQTREAAILMLCDASESASRTLDDATPNRLEQLVHKVATKRLNDGQFDECALTLKELHSIEQSIIKTLCAIYHGRIKYPESPEQTGEAPSEHAAAS